MKCYNHLSLTEREDIAVLHAAGHKPTFIAKQIGRNRSTVYRELKRNRHRQRAL